MAYIINESCINCGDCAPVCPTAVISPGENIYKIEENGCIDCGNCVPVCPVDATVPS